MFKKWSKPIKYRVDIDPDRTLVYRVWVRYRWFPLSFRVNMNRGTSLWSQFTTFEMNYWYSDRTSKAEINTFVKEWLEYGARPNEKDDSVKWTEV